MIPQTVKNHRAFGSKHAAGWARAAMVAVAAVATVLAGCHDASPVTPSPPATTQLVDQPYRLLAMSAERQGPSDPRDPAAPLQAIVHLDIYTLYLPEGSVSTNPDFWKRVDELAVGAAVEDRLYQSGLRTGLASKIDGLFFSQFFDRQSSKSWHSMVEGLRADSRDLEMEKKVDGEDLFYFDQRHRLQGRTYDACTNNFSLSFALAPRGGGAVRLSLCPVITTERQRMNYTPLNQEYETPYEQVDRLYDGGLTVDVPEGSFFIVAPSPDAWRNSSIGGQFLIDRGKAQRSEQVLVIVPTLLRLNGESISLGFSLLHRPPPVRAIPNSAGPSGNGR